MTRCKGAFIPNETIDVLILGTMPGKKSLESDFYYVDKKNRFWDILAKVFNEETPLTVAKRKAFLVKHNIALWDVIKECEREGSLDVNIKNVKVNKEIRNLGAKYIFCNGNTAYKLFKKNFQDLEATLLISSSQAAGWKKNIDDLRGWEKVRVS